MTIILLIFALLMLNGAFAMAEIALVSVKKSRLQQAAEAGNKRARIALKLIENPERILSTVQIGITLVGGHFRCFRGTEHRRFDDAMDQRSPPRKHQRTTNLLRARHRRTYLLQHCHRRIGAEGTSIAQS